MTKTAGLVISSILLGSGLFLTAQDRDFRPVTEAMLRNPAPGDWLNWRRTDNAWGYSPLDQINQKNVQQLQLAWSWSMDDTGAQEAAPLVYDGVMYLPNPRGVIQALDAATGDLIWEYRPGVTPPPAASGRGGGEQTAIPRLAQRPASAGGDLGRGIQKSLAIYDERRFLKPPRMHIAPEGYVILGLISFLMLTLPVFESAGIAAGQLETGVTPPPLAGLVNVFSRENASAVYAGAWWAHVAAILAFAVYLPRTKHLHIVTTLPNVYFRSSRPRGALQMIDDIENKETFGAANIRDFSWKQLLDGYTCTECGRCSDNCPALATGKTLDPQKIVLDIRDQLLREGPKLLADAKAETTPPAHWVETKPDELWACTTCAACVEACPVTIEHIDKIVDMRRSLTLMEGAAPAEAQRAMTNIERAGNPWGEARESRGDWAQGLEIPTFADKPDAEYLYFVGCAASYDRRNQRVARALATILKSAGVSFAILGAAETCNGDPARRMGNEYLYQLQAQQNIETLNAAKVKKVITSCPHCFNTIANEYPQLGGNYEVVHALPLVKQLLDEKKITLTTAPRPRPSRITTPATSAGTTGSTTRRATCSTRSPA